MVEKSDHGTVRFGVRTNKTLRRNERRKETDSVPGDIWYCAKKGESKTKHDIES